MQLVITIQNPVLTLVGLIGNLLSGMVVVSPVPTFYRIYKNKSTESFDSFPYVVVLFSASMWVYYGILTVDVLLLTINVGACILQVIFLIMFLYYASSKSRVYTMKLILLINLGISGSLLLISNLFIKESKRAQITGGICASFAVAVFVAPLTIIRQVIRTKSVEYMPVSLSIFLTMSAVAWFSYGILLGDLFVAIPNVFGFLLGAAQIIIYMKYMNHDKERCSKIGNQGTEAPAEIELPAEAKSNSEIIMACERAECPWEKKVTTGAGIVASDAATEVTLTNGATGALYTVPRDAATLPTTEARATLRVATDRATGATGTTRVPTAVAVPVATVATGTALGSNPPLIINKDVTIHTLQTMLLLGILLYEAAATAATGATEATEASEASEALLVGLPYEADTAGALLVTAQGAAPGAASE
ncbi:bidirectional sugar transporter SWEET9-like [Curcuma longa]|uniref:bidirectional sugar transporter SWEET9-like n=1 Tax=Curcuma longa TaxID=136217 RepID=UPI003D9E000F